MRKNRFSRPDYLSAAASRLTFLTQRSYGKALLAVNQHMTLLFDDCIERHFALPQPAYIA
jgi:hypothetical protein